MPKITAIKASDNPGHMWVELHMPGPQGELSLYTKEELKRRDDLHFRDMIESMTQLHHEGKL